MNSETNKSSAQIGILPGVVCAIVFGYASFFLLFMMGMGFFKCYAIAATIGGVSLFIPALLLMARQSFETMSSAQLHSS